MKKLLVVLLTLSLSLVAFTKVDATELKGNEATLYYMYSTDQGMYFLEPTAEYENVIFIGYNDFKQLKNINLHHGMKFIGIFSDTNKWELDDIYVKKTSKN